MRYDDACVERVRAHVCLLFLEISAAIRRTRSACRSVGRQFPTFVSCRCPTGWPVDIAPKIHCFERENVATVCDQFRRQRRQCSAQLSLPIQISSRHSFRAYYDDGVLRHQCTVRVRLHSLFVDLHRDMASNQSCVPERMEYLSAIIGSRHLNDHVRISHQDNTHGSRTSCFASRTEFWSIELSIFFAARLGARSLSAQVCAYQTAWLFYLITSSFATAANIRIGQFLGAGKPMQAANAKNVTYTVGAVVILINICLISIGHYWFPIAYDTGADALTLARRVLLLIAFLQLWDGYNVINTGIVKAW